MEKHCGTCKRDKNVKEFNKNKSKKDGYNTICRICSNKKSRIYYEENRESHIIKIGEKNKVRILENRRKIFEYYSTHPCIDCGEDNPIVLEMDHVRGKKKNGVSVMVGGGYSWNVIEKEIEKCEVRCANCHRKKTAKDFNWYDGLVMPL